MVEGEISFGRFRLNFARRELRRDDRPVRLGGRALDILCILAEAGGAVVTKDELMARVWAGVVVEENNLQVHISALRKALEEDGNDESGIVTVPGRGYRLLLSRGPPTADDPTPGRTLTVPHREPQRRQITALSCELVGEAPRADGVGLEELREAIRSYEHGVSETIDRYGGFIARRLGDNLLVLFGYPEAHEHDAERAVRAGLELCAAVKGLRLDPDLPMRCRVGIATGLVIIGDPVGVGAHEIVGDLQKLAARLLASAYPDTVAIDPATHRLIGNLFDYRALGAIDTNSGPEPTHPWQVLGESLVASRFEALRGAALSPLIGRDEELELLSRRWARAKAGDGQTVLVSGEPGIGKSRLIAAVEERLHAEPHLRLHYFCSPHHQDSTLFPFVDQLSHAAGFTGNDRPAAKLEKLEALLARAPPPDEDIALLADLLSLPGSERHPLPNLSPHRKKERTLEALLRQLEGLAHQQPVVVVFEDAHWIDPTSRELLDLTVERIPSLPVLLIVTFRPEFQPPWTGQPRVTM